MENIPLHKVFISYCHEQDQWYKNELLRLNKHYHFFDDYSLREDEFDDNGMSDEQVRRTIRENYIADATVLILLCGKNTRKCKYIDWEIQAAMCDSELNPRMGIIVIDLPTIALYSRVLACDLDEEQVMGSDIIWHEASRNLEEIQRAHPYLPDRLAKNLTRDEVVLTIASWENIRNDSQAIKIFVDNAFKRRESSNFDVSEKLQDRA